jgi:hypothetical protein
VRWHATARHKARWRHISIILSSPCVIAIDASLWSAVGSWWALREGLCPLARRVIGLQKRKLATKKIKWINRASGVPAGGELVHNVGMCMT